MWHLFSASISHRLKPPPLPQHFTSDMKAPGNPPKSFTFETINEELYAKFFSWLQQKKIKQKAVAFEGFQISTRFQTMIPKQTNQTPQDLDAAPPTTHPPSRGLQISGGHLWPRAFCQVWQKITFTARGERSRLINDSKKQPFLSQPRGRGPPGQHQAGERCLSPFSATCFSAPRRERWEGEGTEVKGK